MYVIMVVMDNVYFILWKMRIVYVYVYGCVREWEGRDNSGKGYNDNEILGLLCV